MPAHAAVPLASLSHILALNLTVPFPWRNLLSRNSNTAKAGGLNWAYREAQPDPSKASADKPDVLLLHGLGSSSYCYR